MQIWNHPDILYQFVAQMKEDDDLDLDDTRSIDVRGRDSPSATMPRGHQRSRGGFHRSNTSSSLDELIGAIDVNRKDSVISYDWVWPLAIFYFSSVVCLRNLLLVGN